MLQRFLFIMVLASIFICSPIVADEEKEDPKATQDEEKILNASDKDFGERLSKLPEKRLRDVLRCAFVVKGAQDKEWLFIRLVFGQYFSVKVKSGLKGVGVVRVILSPRQRLAIRHALKLDKPVPKAIIRVSAKRLKYAKGLKGHYVVRPAKYFRDFLGNPGKDGCEEEKEQTEGPVENLIGNLKDADLLSGLKGGAKEPEPPVEEEKEEKTE